MRAAFANCGQEMAEIFPEDVTSTGCNDDSAIIGSNQRLRKEELALANKAVNAARAHRARPARAILNTAMKK